MHDPMMMGFMDFRAFPHLRRLEIRGAAAEYAIENLSEMDDYNKPVCRHLKELIIEFRMPESESASRALSRGDKSFVRDHLSLSRKEHCFYMMRILRRRAKRGCYIKRLEFGYVEDQWDDSPNSHCTFDLLSFTKRERADIFGYLGRLVRGPIVFTGYRFYAYPVSNPEIYPDSKLSNEDRNPDIYYNMKIRYSVIITVSDTDTNEDEVEYESDEGDTGDEGDDDNEQEVADT